MPVLLVTYDLKKENNSNSYQQILNIIKSEKNWARISESSYAMHTNMTPKDVYDKFKLFIDSNDNIMIFTLNKPYHGFHSKAVIDWLNSKIV